MLNYLKTGWNLNSSQLVDVYDELSLWAAPFGLQLLDGIVYKNAINAVDIGFGNGFPLTELAMRLGRQSTVYGIDPWRAAAKRAQKKIDFYGITNVKIINGVAENIPLNNNTIDLIVSNNGLNNVKNLDIAFDECARILKPGGQFIQTMNLDNTMHEFYTAFEIILKSLNLHNCIDLMHQQILKKRKPLNTVTNMLQNKGFAVETVDHHKFEYKFVDATAMFNHHFIRLAFIDGWKNIVPENMQTEVFTLVEKYLNIQAQHVISCKIL